MDQANAQPRRLTFGEWLRTQPIEPHVLPPYKPDDWPERMIAKYKRDTGQSLETSALFQLTLFDGAA